MQSWVWDWEQRARPPPSTRGDARSTPKAAPNPRSQGRGLRVRFSRKGVDKGAGGAVGAGHAGAGKQGPTPAIRTAGWGTRRRDWGRQQSQEGGLRGAGMGREARAPRGRGRARERPTHLSHARHVEPRPPEPQPRGLAPGRLGMLKAGASAAPKRPIGAGPAATSGAHAAHFRRPGPWPRRRHAGCGFS